MFAYNFTRLFRLFRFSTDLVCVRACVSPFLCSFLTHFELGVVKAGKAFAEGT